jgi:Endosomal/lysosomal potassium channel TMEM175
LVAFSDAVFAITITLLVLEIRPPTDYSNLLHDLLALWPSYLAYGVTFLVYDAFPLSRDADGVASPLEAPPSKKDLLVGGAVWWSMQPACAVVRLQSPGASGLPDTG